MGSGKNKREVVGNKVWGKTAIRENLTASKNGHAGGSGNPRGVLDAGHRDRGSPQREAKVLGGGIFVLWLMGVLRRRRQGDLPGAWRELRVPLKTGGGGQRGREQQGKKVVES